LEKSSYIVTSSVVIILTGFFILPVLFLFSIQLKNLLLNRTTNERFSRKKPPKRKLLEKGDLAKMDSTGSSLVSLTTSMINEDIIREYGDPEDF
jgi:hypothetical protein